MTTKKERADIRALNAAGDAAVDKRAARDKIFLRNWARIGRAVHAAQLADAGVKAVRKK